MNSRLVICTRKEVGRRRLEWYLTEGKDGKEKTFSKFSFSQNPPPVHLSHGSLVDIYEAQKKPPRKSQKQYHRSWCSKFHCMVLFTSVFWGVCLVTPSVLVQPSTQTFFGVRHAFLQQDARRAIRTSSCETGPCRNRLRAVPLQSVESKLGRTGESENSFPSPSCFLLSLDFLARVTTLRDC